MYVYIYIYISELKILKVLGQALFQVIKNPQDKVDIICQIFG